MKKLLQRYAFSSHKPYESNGKFALPHFGRGDAALYRPYARTLRDIRCGNTTAMLWALPRQSAAIVLPTCDAIGLSPILLIFISASSTEGGSIYREVYS